MRVLLLPLAVLCLLTLGAHESFVGEAEARHVCQHPADPCCHTAQCYALTLLYTVIWLIESGAHDEGVRVTVLP